MTAAYRYFCAVCWGMVLDKNCWWPWSSHHLCMSVQECSVNVGINSSSNPVSEIYGA